jgi:hypothetical protein
VTYGDIIWRYVRKNKHSTPYLSSDIILVYLRAIYWVCVSESLLNVQHHLERTNSTGRAFSLVAVFSRSWERRYGLNNNVCLYVQWCRSCNATVKGEINDNVTTKTAL